MAVRKRGQRWWYDFTINHVRYRGPLPKVRTKRAAEDEEHRIRVSVLDGTYGRPSPTTIKEFVEQVYWPWALANRRSIIAHEYEVKVVVNYFGARPLIEITPMLIERFKRERLAAPRRQGGLRKPATVNLELAALSRILSMAKANRLIKESPMKEVSLLRLNNERNRHLSDEEEHMIMMGLTGNFERFRPVIIIALNTGMRLGEIVGLTWSAIDWGRQVIHLVETKNGKPRDIPINQAVAQTLQGLRAIQSERDRLFDFSAPIVTWGWRRLTKKLGLVDLHFHDLRHTFATRIADAGIDPFTIAELLGHSSLKPTMRYTHALQANKRRAVAHLENAERNSHKIVTMPSLNWKKTG